MISPSIQVTGSHRAAPFLARLVACGLLGRAEALAALLFAAAPVQTSPCGRHARLLKPPAPATADCASTRTQAAAAARRALQPLLQTYAPHRKLLDTAKHAAGSALGPAEIQVLTIDAVARHLRQRRAARPHTRPGSPA